MKNAFITANHALLKLRDNLVVAFNHQGAVDEGTQPGPYYNMIKSNYNEISQFPWPDSAWQMVELMHHN